MPDDHTLKAPARPPATRVAHWLAVILVSLAGLVTLAYVGAVGYTAATSPECARCHLTGEFAAATDARPHAGVECSACHGGLTFPSRVAFGNAQVLGMYLELIELDPSTSEVQPEACLSCHAGVLDATAEVGGLRIDHEQCAATRTCTECHSIVAHGGAVAWPRTTAMEMCFDCHGGRGIPDHCTLCHTGQLADDRIRTGTFAVTHGPRYMQTHGMGEMTTCVPCHQPQRCAECHGAGLPHGPDFMRTHAAAANSADARCETCHQETFCTDCHLYEMPHPDEFTPEHAGIVRTEGEDGCRRCHAENDCVECHVLHVHPVTAEQLRSLGLTPRTAPGD